MIDRVRLRGVLPALLLCGLAAGCAEPAQGDGRDEPERRVTLVTDESWQLPKELRAAFERQTDLKLVHRKVGRTPAELVEELAQHKGKPFGDVVMGIDTSTARPALGTETLAPYTSPEANKGQQRFSVDEQLRLSAVDRLITCVLVDDRWYTEHELEPPSTVADLSAPAHRDELVLPDPRASADGVSFLLGFAARGDESVLGAIADNGAQVAPGVARVEAEFTAGNEDGTRPLAVGPLTLVGELAEADDEITVSPLEGSCHEQVRYAGVLAEASNSQRAGLLLDFLLSQQFQQALPEEFGSYPVRKGVELPEGWDDQTLVPDGPSTLPARTADADRKRALAEWSASRPG